MSSKNKRLPRGIRLRGDRFFVDVTVKDAGRRTATCETLEEARKKQKELRDELEAIARGEPVQREASVRPRGPASWSLVRAIEHTKMLPAPEGWRGSKSAEKTAINADAALPFFGPDRPVQEITPSSIDEYVAYLMKLGNSNGTVNRKLAALSKVLGVIEARSEGEYRKPKFPRRLREGRGRIRQLSPDEELAVLDWFMKLGDPDGRDVAICLLDTGMRVSELLGIECRDLDFSQGFIFIYGRDAKGTKNGDYRSVPMTSRVQEILKRRKYSHGDIPFPYDRHWFTRHWNHIRHRMGMDEDDQFIPHMLRHTCASRLVQRGVSLKIVQEWMGHKTIQMTMRYAHLYPKDLMSARDALEPVKDPVD